MATITKTRDGKHWVLGWVEPGGSRHRPRIGKVGIMSEREANMIRKGKEVELATGQPMRAVRSAHAERFRFLAKKYLIWHEVAFPASHSYVKRNVNNRLVPEFGDMVLEDIDVERTEQYLAKRSREIPTPNPNTVLKELNTLKAMIKKAIEWKLLTHDAIRKVPKPQSLDSKPKHFYTPAQLAQLWTVDSPYTPIWKLFVNTGMRRAEGLALKKENTVNGTVNILSTSKARSTSAKWRAVPIGPGCRKALDAITPDAAGYLIPRVTGHTLTRAFERDRKAAKLKAGTLHSLRHTFITLLIQQGRPLRVVQVLAGHSSIVTTEGYAHVSPNFAERATHDLDL